MKQYSKFLNSISDLGNKAIIKACKDAGLQQIGSGSCRVVFALNDRMVIKIALGSAGVEQNANEIRVHYMLNYDFPGWKKYYAKIYPDLGHCRDYFIVMERLDTDFPGRRAYAKELYRMRYNPNNVKNRRAVLQHKAVQYMDDLLCFKNANDMHIKNLGMSANGCIKLLDFGLSNRTLHRHYGLSDRRRIKRERLY